LYKFFSFERSTSLKTSKFDGIQKDARRSKFEFRFSNIKPIECANNVTSPIVQFYLLFLINKSECVSVCLFVRMQQYKYSYLHCCTTIYIVRISRKNYIYCCTTIYIVRISGKKLYILLHNNIYVLQGKTIYIVLTGTVTYIVA
jgi:hypothetical protein